MKALVYHGAGKRELEDVPKPLIKTATDAIVRISKTTICGTDLHILNGDVPTVTQGRILGHEGIGTIEQVGGNVSNFSIVNLDKLWSQNITLTTRLVDTVTTPMLMKTVASGKIQPGATDNTPFPAG